MRHLVFLAPGRVEWQDAPEPAVGGALEAVVEPVAVATCDLDVAILRGTFRAFPGQFPLGHEGVARVTDVGDAVASVSPGDLVVVPFQISCGTCRACQAGRTGNCQSVALGSMYGYEPFGGPWGGFLADKVRVPYADAMLVRLAPAIDPAAVASLSDNVADAWRTVGPPLAEAPGSEVLIVGGAGGSVPLYAIQQALALGAPAVPRAARARGGRAPPSGTRHLTGGGLGDRGGSPVRSAEETGPDALAVKAGQPKPGHASGGHLRGILLVTTAGGDGS